MRLRPALLVAVVVCTAGCRLFREPPPPPTPITSVLVKSFQCENPIVAEAVRNVIVGRLVEDSGARIVREGSADVVVEGTITMLHGGGSKGGAAVFASGGVLGGGASESASGGDWVAGVTALVTRDGEVMASADSGQELSGKSLQPPEELARRVADRLAKALKDKGLARR